MPLTCLAIAACVLAAAPPAGGGQTGDPRSRVLAYLQSHDVAVLAELRALASAPDQTLMAIVEDARQESLVRARAVAALRLLPSPAVQDFLGKLLRAKAKSNDETDRLLLRRAAVAIGWMAGPRASADLALLFENADPDVRLDAVIGLGLTRAADVPDRLRRQLAVETKPRVRDQIEKQLRVLVPPPPEPEKPARKEERPPMRSGF